MQFVAVQHDGTLAPGSGAIGVAEQFDLYELGAGLLALKSVANRKYVTAARSEKLVASGRAIGEEQIFRRIENLAWRDGGLAFDVVMAGAAPGAGNLLAPEPSRHRAAVEAQARLRGAF